MRHQLTALTGLIIATLAITAQAFSPIPRESAKALKVTRGESFSAGAVFINGKYIEPPYVVERWGTGIRINGQSVTGQVIDWHDFVKAQSGMKLVKTEVVESVAESAPEAEPAPIPVSEPEPEVSAAALDSLFDDEPEAPRLAEIVKPAPPPSVSKAKASQVAYSVEGEFRPNKTTKAMVARINTLRTQLDQTLRFGGFICFGDTYSYVTGDARMLLTFMEHVCELQRDATSAADFRQRARNAGLIYRHELVCDDLYRNRTDARKLQERYKKMKRDSEAQSMLDELSTPLL